MITMAAVVRELIAAGVTGDALVTAIERIETAGMPVRSAGAERTARWRERHKASQNVTCDVPPSPLVPPLEVSPAPLPKTPPIIPPPFHHGTRARGADGSKTPTQRGTRIPHDFQSTPNITALALARGLTEMEIIDQLERFRDWANAATGQVGLKRDWNAAFRNWIKRVADDKQRKSSPYGNRASPAQAMRDAFDDLDSHIAGRRQPAG